MDRREFFTNGLIVGITRDTAKNKQPKEGRR